MGEQRDALLEKFKLKLDEWNLEIAQLQAQTKGKHDLVLVSYNKQIEVLEIKRDGLKDQMAKLSTLGEVGWEALREEIGGAWKLLGDSIEETKLHFK